MRSTLIPVALLVSGLSLACSSGGSTTSSSSSSSSGDPVVDAALPVDASSTQDGISGDGGVTAPERMTLTVDGVDIPIDQASVTIENALEGGARVTKLRARIIDAEKYPWNDEKTPAYVQLDDVQLESVPHPTGDIRCVRSINDLQYTIISVKTASGSPLKSTDASCSAQVATWTDGVAYRGSAKGLVTGSGTYAFTFAWNVTK